MKLTSSQLFVIALVALALLAGAAYLDRTYLPVLVSSLLGFLYLFTHINGAANGAANVVQGVNLGVPLSTTPGTLATATLGSASATSDWPQGVPG